MKRTLYLLTMPIKGCSDHEASGIDISIVSTSTTSPITTSTGVSAPTTIQPSHDSGKCGGTCSHGSDLLKRSSDDGISVVAYFKESCFKPGVAKQTDCAYFRYSGKNGPCVYTHEEGFCSCNEGTGEFTLDNESCRPRMLEMMKDTSVDIAQNPTTAELCKAIGLTGEESEFCKTEILSSNPNISE